MRAAGASGRPVAAGFWHQQILHIKASVLSARPTTDSFVQIRNQRTALHLAGNFDPKELALFVCYFSLLSGGTALLVP